MLAQKLWSTNYLKKCLYRPSSKAGPRSVFRYVQAGIEENWNGEELKPLRYLAYIFRVVLQRDAMKLAQALGIWLAMYTDV